LEHLFIRAKDELFLLELNLVRFVNFTRHKLDRLNYQRHNKHFSGVLLFVTHDCFNVRAQFDLVVA
jgi:hypothetical protein